jgi:hypothetical protein
LMRREPSAKIQCEQLPAHQTPGAASSQASSKPISPSTGQGQVPGKEISW